MKEQIKPLEWSETSSPNTYCGYHHTFADTPFGRFLITWKGWKKFDVPTVDETPWNSFGGAYHTVDLAKEWCEKEYQLKLAECFVED